MANARGVDMWPHHCGLQVDPKRSQPKRGDHDNPHVSRGCLADHFRKSKCQEWKRKYEVTRAHAPPTLEVEREHHKQPHNEYAKAHLAPCAMRLLFAYRIEQKTEQGDRRERKPPQKARGGRKQVCPNVAPRRRR
jgi:hypothetical protein